MELESRSQGKKERTCYIYIAIAIAYWSTLLLVEAQFEFGAAQISICLNTDLLKKKSDKESKTKCCILRHRQVGGPSLKGCVWSGDDTRDICHHLFLFFIPNTFKRNSPQPSRKSKNPQTTTTTTGKPEIS